VVALTFDAGAYADGLPAVLATLHAGSVPATFFVTGDFAARDPAAVRRIVADGHRLGNHSATHPHFTRLSAAAVRSQLRQAEAAIRAAGAADPRPLFRFPYGDRDSHTIGVVNAAGWVCVRWTVDTLGWKGTDAGVTLDEVVSRVVTTAQPGQIVLMHVGSIPDDGSTLDADALPAVIAGLRARGYGFVTLDASLS
jgi:peptidoglycan/xylan/chitin deacetylase (PgdA/CDA1 family)